jgi:predicted nuclease of predicted toxin-antitoxin system
MRILIDNCVVKRFGPLITDHETTHASQLGWSKLENGDLIRTAEEAGYEVMITVDKNLQYQQSLAGRKISIIVLSPIFVYYEDIAALVPQVILALDNLPSGSFVVIRP